MFDLGYVSPEEVREIPRLGKGPKAILYAPLGEVHATPDVVLVACKPAGAMLLEEAAGRAGVGTACQHWEGRLAWRCLPRPNTERSRAWVASGTGCTRVLLTRKCTCSCEEKIWPQWQRLWKRSRRPTLRCRITRGRGGNSAPQFEMRRWVAAVVYPYENL